MRRTVKIQSQRQRLGTQSFEVRDVFKHIARGDAFLVRERENSPIAIEEGETGRLAALLDERIAQAIRPGGRRLGDPLLDRGQIDLAATFGIRADNHVHSGMDGARDLHMALDALAVEAFEHDLLDALSHFGAVAVTGNVDEARIKTMVRVATRQYAHRPAFVEVDDPTRNADQVIDARLKQLVPRIRLEHIEDGLAVVPVRIEAEVLDDFFHFAAQDWNVTRTSVVSARSPQSEKPVFTADSAAIVESLDADIVQVFAAMHGRDGVGLRNDQKFAIARPCTNIAAQLRYG